MSTTKAPKKNISTEKDLYLRAYKLMATAKSMTEIYEVNAKLTSKYVHATSRGHEAIQLAVGMQLKPQDFVAPYYRDDSILLGIGMEPYELMLQLFAKKDDPFSGGRSYYSHPSLNRDDMPKIPHQSSATGMQAIPITGVAMAIQYMEQQELAPDLEEKPIVVCSIGDAAMTEGEVSEAFQMAALKQIPILFLVQDNEWDISAHAREVRANDAAHFAKGFKGIEIEQVEGNDFIACYSKVKKIFKSIRETRKPYLLHASVPLLGHHTSGVRMEWYRDDLEEHKTRDPYDKFTAQLRKLGISDGDLKSIERSAQKIVSEDFDKAQKAEDPSPIDLFDHDYAPTPVTVEKGLRTPQDGELTLMVDCALHAVQEILAKHPEALLYGQDVGGRLGGVFREAATLAQKFGDDRVFNTPIVEAFIIGSTVGMSVAGCKPIVEVQFADYIWPGLNQLFTEASRSYYLSNGKWNVQSLIRVPIGAYGSGGPYHSSSIESVLCNIGGIKVIYPSNGADMKGLMKSAFYDPNPTVILEHKGLYWSKIKGTEEAKSIEPDEDYIIPLGKGRIALEASEEKVTQGESACVIAYGMGVYWAKTAAKNLGGSVEIIDLRTLVPLDQDLIIERVKHHGRCLVITEEPKGNTFAQSLVGIIQENCFEDLDAPVMSIGSERLPAIPLNEVLEKTMLPNAEKVQLAIQKLLDY
ncbi:MAG: 2-oxoisovalerate dehydrogenase E1 component [Patiriisocius sp.]|jgi:2-oxoisovalerate dehydrogenase E1 component